MRSERSSVTNVAMATVVDGCCVAIFIRANKGLYHVVKSFRVNSDWPISCYDVASNVVSNIVIPF